jgi:hypothetical protein
VQMAGKALAEVCVDPSLGVAVATVDGSPREAVVLAAPMPALAGLSVLPQPVSARVPVRSNRRSVRKRRDMACS